MEEYVCKIATVDDMNIKWDYEIEHATDDKENWIIWKESSIKNMRNGSSIAYYGVLNDKIICEGTAMINPEIIQNSNNLIDSHTVYLNAFRTIEEYQGKGYFSRLFKFMINDLKAKGYTRVTIGVEPNEIKNMLIYFNYGFDEYIKTGVEVYPDGTKINVNYYAKVIN